MAPLLLVTALTCFASVSASAADGEPAELTVEAVGRDGNDLPADGLLNGERVGGAWMAMRLPMCSERVGLRGTPSFMINGRRLVGAQPLTAFEAIVDEEIARSKAAGRRGKAWYRSIIAKGRNGQ